MPIKHYYWEVTTDAFKYKIKYSDMSFNEIYDFIERTINEYIACKYTIKCMIINKYNINELRIDLKANQKNKLDIILNYLNNLKNIAINNCYLLFKKNNKLSGLYLQKITKIEYIDCTNYNKCQD